jgi:peptidyl-prolyl cis-trans isomerase SurA
LSRILMAAAIAASAVPAAAQEGLGIAAVVNDDVVTMLDLTDRVLLVVRASNIPDSPEARGRIAPQALRALIEEQLKMQEAKRLGINVGDREIDTRLAAIAKQSGIDSVEAFVDMLKRNGIPVETMRSQIAAEVAWVRVARRVLGPSVNISEEQVDEALAQIESEVNQPAYLVSEIFLAVDNLESEAEVAETARRLVTQLRGGADFASVARQFSQAANAARDGDLGWVSPSEIESSLRAALATLSPGEISEPVRGTSGFHILQLRDRRERRGALEGATATLAQVFYPLPENPDAEAVARVTADAHAGTEALTSCEGMIALAGQVSPAGAQSLLKDIPFSDMPPELYAVASESPLNQATAPLEVPGGLVVLMVCDRQGASGVPSREEIRDRLARDRLEVLARGYLRDLRRSAIIDIRI